MIEENGKAIAAFGKKIGETTNNVAEYTAVVEALLYLVDREPLGKTRDKQGTEDKIESIEFFLDSTLVVNQLNGLFKVKESHLRELLLRVRGLEEDMGCFIRYHAIPREQNELADALVNEALDS